MIELNDEQIRRITGTLNKLHLEMVSNKHGTVEHAYAMGKSKGMSDVLSKIGYDVCYDMDEDRLYLQQESRI